jgi:putative ABC transport system substrate-binding protein
VKRREFITLVGAAVAAWSRAARAQQGERMRRIGVLMSTAADDPESQLRLVAFVQGLQQAGWTDSQNIQIDTRWGSGDSARIRKYTTELLALSPDVILAGGRAASIVPEVRRAGRDTPIVFVQGVDPVGTGYIASLARPGGNATGFTQFEYTLSGKWLQLLKEIVPSMTRAAVLRESGGAGIGQWAVIQAVASSLAVEVAPINAGDMAEVEHAFAAFAGEPNGGLIVAVSSWATVHRELTIALAAKHRVPAIYPYRYFVAGGGLVS